MVRPHEIERRGWFGTFAPSAGLGNTGCCVRFKRRSYSPLKKKAHRGFRGYPVATIAFYGPDDRRATKVAVGIIMNEGGEPAALNRWFSKDEDVRFEGTIGAEILRFIQDHGAKSVIAADRIIGCPHEEGVDYPEGAVCPLCPFWAHRDRGTGDVIQ